jgi:hypothetical protein
MKANKMISFHYKQQNATSNTDFHSFSSHHIINTTKILKFTYQKVEPIPKYQQIALFSSASYEPSV